jgi:hypothetical protein
MNVKRSALWLVLLGILAIGLAMGPDLWAAPGQNLERQTVPTKTPTSQPPKTQPTLAPTATVEVTPTQAPSEPLLPEAGGRGILCPLLGAAMIAVGLLAIRVVKRLA